MNGMGKGLRGLEVSCVNFESLSCKFSKFHSFLAMLMVGLEKKLATASIWFWLFTALDM